MEKELLLSELERLGRHDIIESFADFLKGMEPAERDEIIKALPDIVSIGEKPLSKKRFNELYSKGLIERPRKGDRCIICLKGTVRMHSHGRGSWELSCDNRSCDYLYDED